VHEFDPEEMDLLCNGEKRVDLAAKKTEKRNFHIGR